jgi:hypothetical protein
VHQGRAAIELDPATPLASLPVACSVASAGRDQVAGVGEQAHRRRRDVGMPTATLTTLLVATLSAASYALAVKAIVPASAGLKRDRVANTGDVVSVAISVAPR